MLVFAQLINVIGLVGEPQMTNLSSDTSKPDGVPVAGSPFHAFMQNFPKHVHKYLKFDLNALKRDYISAWTDSSPEIKKSVPKGSLCNLSVKLDVGLPPDAVYNIVIDPDNKNIKEVKSRKVLADKGSRQVVELEQAAIWRFLRWSGTVSVHVLVDHNREDHSMKFKQIKTGFMKQFEGCWKVEPILVDEQLCQPIRPKTVEEYDRCTKGKGRIASRVSLKQLIQPAVVAPPPISWYLRGITSRTTEMIINDLRAETARIRESSSTVDAEALAKTSQEFYDEGQAPHDIKERWALRRRNSKHCRRRC